MQLIIVRHAKAKQRDASLWPDDRERPLTKSGRSDFARLAKRLSHWMKPPDVMLSSTWVRAWETASILCNETRWPHATRCELLESEGGDIALHKLLDMLRSRATQPSLALVGHEPLLSELIGHLLGGNALISLAKGAVAWLDINALEGRGTLRALVPPEAVRRSKARCNL